MSSSLQIQEDYSFIKNEFCEILIALPESVLKNHIKCACCSLKSDKPVKKFPCELKQSLMYAIHA